MEKIINPQSYAVGIEHELCKIFDCDRWGFGGVVSSDFIRKSPCAAMLCCIGYIYKDSNSSKQDLMLAFINKYSFYSNYGIDGIIKEFGIEELEKVIREFKELIL